MQPAAYNTPSQGWGESIEIPVPKLPLVSVLIEMAQRDSELGFDGTEVFRADDQPCRDPLMGFLDINGNLQSCGLIEYIASRLDKARKRPSLLFGHMSHVSHDLTEVVPQGAKRARFHGRTPAESLARLYLAYLRS